MKCMLAAVLAILHEFQSVRVIFLVFLGVIISLLALTAGESHFDSCIISHLAAPPIMNYLILPEGGSVYLPPESIGRRFPGCASPENFRGTGPQRKSPLAEVLILYHIRESLSSPFSHFFFCFPFYSSKKHRIPHRSTGALSNLPEGTISPPLIEGS